MIEPSRARESALPLASDSDSDFDFYDATGVYALGESDSEEQMACCLCLRRVWRPVIRKLVTVGVCVIGNGEQPSPSGEASPTDKWAARPRMSVNASGRDGQNGIRFHCK